jgi:hypothetical protein
MSRSHNKKRNVGIIYELLLRNISSHLVAKNNKLAQESLDLLTNHFNKSSEIYKEFRLFNALANATVSDSAVAAGILSEAKQAARRCNIKKLNHEKSMLIREINHKLKDPSFYHRRINNYRIYATIQTLLNDWREVDTADLTRVINYETQVVHRLLEKKEVSSLSESLDPNVDGLIVKIMTDKLNDKYGNTLNESQKDIIRSYVFSMSDDGGTSILKKLNGLKGTTLLELKQFRDKTDNSVLLEKIDRVEKKLSEYLVSDINDDQISKFLTISKLKSELEEALSEK